MIRATKADLNAAETDLRAAIRELLNASVDWLREPTAERSHKATQVAFTDANEAYAKHAETLAAWAAGPNGDDRG